MDLHGNDFEDYDITVNSNFDLNYHLDFNHYLGLNYSTGWNYHLDLKNVPTVNDFQGFAFDLEMIRYCGRLGLCRDYRFHWITAYAITYHDSMPLILQVRHM